MKAITKSALRGDGGWAFETINRKNAHKRWGKVIALSPDNYFKRVLLVSGLAPDGVAAGPQHTNLALAGARQHEGVAASEKEAIEAALNAYPDFSPIAPTDSALIAHARPCVLRAMTHGATYLEAIETTRKEWMNADAYILWVIENCPEKLQEPIRPDEWNAQTIHALRLRLDMTQQQFAEALGLASHVSVSRYENDVSKPHRLIISKLNELDSARSTK